MKYRWCAVVLAGVLALGGCSSGAEPAASPEPSVPSAVETVPPSESPSPAPASPSASPTSTELLIFPNPPEDESPEVAEIREAWMAYERLIDRYYRDPEFTDLNALNGVATGEELNVATREIIDSLAQNFLLVGSVVFSSVDIEDPSRNVDGILVSRVSYCVDSSQAKTVNSVNGDLVYQAEETMRAEMLMEQLPDGEWRAALLRSEFVPC